MHKWSWTAVAACLIFAASRSVEAASVPYEAVVIADNTYVRSGPGTNYYDTGKLDRGERVTVEREEAGGWLAIRPPRGSFSWVAAQYVQENSDGTGTMTGDNVLIRVGTPKSDLRDVFHVKAGRGATVKILEKRLLGEGAGARPWYRIEPPDGEYRWIASQLVQPTAAGSAGAAEPHGKPAAGGGEGPAAKGRSSPAASTTRGASKSGSASAGGPVRPKGGSERPAASDDLAELVREAEAAYTEMIEKDVSEWELGAVKEMYDEILERSPTPTLRGLASRRLQQIAQHETLHRNYMAFAGIMGQTQERDRKLLAIQRQKEDQLSQPPKQFDGTGLLRRTAPGGPLGIAYALYSPQGAVRYFVSPTPGMNFEPYVNRPVAVMGRVAYRPDLRGHHIDVHQVVPIDTGP